MRLLWTAVRALAIVAALITFSLTILFVTSPSGTTIDPTGALIDAVAAAVLVAAAWSLWRDRARLV